MENNPLTLFYLRGTWKWKYIGNVPKSTSQYFARWRTFSGVKRLYDQNIFIVGIRLYTGHLEMLCNSYNDHGTETQVKNWWEYYLTLWMESDALELEIWCCTKNHNQNIRSWRSISHKSGFSFFRGARYWTSSISVGYSNSTIFLKRTQ